MHKEEKNLFFHLYKYRLKQLLKDRSVIFWTAMFPIILGTFFYVALYHASDSQDNSFKAVPVAVYDSGSYKNEKEFQAFLKEVTSKEANYLKITTVSGKSQGENLLKKGKVEGFITADSKISLQVTSSDFNTSILKNILDHYLQTENMYEDAAMNHPQILADLSGLLAQNQNYTKNVSFGGKSLNNMIGYFYSLLAMSMLYGSIFSFINALQIQPGTNEIAARRLITPTHKMLIVLSDFCSALTLQMGIYLVVMLYLTKILGVDFGGTPLTLFVAGLAGNMAGSGWGYFVAIVIKGSEKMKMALNMMLTLFSSFLSGLMVGNMKPLLMTYAPWVNKINPATLISDAFYYICIYGNKAEYVRCIATLFSISAFFCIAAYFSLRRKTYASI